MNGTFVDTAYLVVLADPHDQWHEAALRAASAVQHTPLVTTYEVLGEFLGFIAKAGPFMRSRALQIVQLFRTDPAFRIVEETARDGFDRGLSLYERRPDKGYSLVDCISMETMRREGIIEVLTNDHHFEQEGFILLIR